MCSPENQYKMISHFMCSPVISRNTALFIQHAIVLDLACTDSTDHPFLHYLEVLLTNQRAEEHHSLLTWCIQHLRTASVERTGDLAMDVGVPRPQGDGGDGREETDGGEEGKEMTDAEREAKERREKGLQRRAQLMSQISVMQRRFLKEHKEELDQIDADLDSG